ncbi:MAG TPA: DUF2799 domain-containing protein [Solimonas sp.]
MNTIRTTLSMGLLLACSACATLDEGTCRTGDWRQIGYQDGLRGHGTGRLAEHQKSCSAHGVAADNNAWHVGYVQGQGQYCTAANGYREGRDGASYGDVCPPASDAEFRPAWRDGRELASRVASLRTLERELDQIGETLAEDDRRSDAHIAAVRSGRQPPAAELLGPGERRRAERDFDQRAADHAQLLDEISQRDAELSARYQVAPLRLEARR